MKSEQELVRKAKNDPVAFGELYDRYYQKMFNYVLHRTANVQVTQDIVSVLFIKVFKHLKNYAAGDVPFSAWIYRIASNEIANHFRNKNNKMQSLDTMIEKYGFAISDSYDVLKELEDAQDQIERKAAFKRIQSLLCSLDIKYQEVISLRFFEKKKIAEISLILGKNEGTVKSLLSRGLEKLRQPIATK